MGKIGGRKLQAFCVNRIRPLVKVPLHNKISSSDSVRRTELNDQVNQGNSSELVKESEKVIRVAAGRKIMVVVDSSAAAKAALQWTLTRTVQSHDSILLLYVSKQGKEGAKRKMYSKVYEVLHAMKKTCQSTRHEVKVDVKIIEGKESKGASIVEEARIEEVSLLVLGQRKRSTALQLLLMWVIGNKVVGCNGGLVDYCIQNATCMALAVTRNSNKVGGYMITTKRLKDFWLLA